MTGLGAEDPVLFGEGHADRLGEITESDATCQRRGAVLAVRTGTKVPWPGITIRAGGGKWDLSRFHYLEVQLRNTGERPATIHCRVDNPGADGREHCLTGQTTVPPRETRALTVPFHQTPWVLSEPLELIGMRGYPQAEGKLDPSNVVGLVVYVNRPKENHAFEIRRIEAGGATTVLDSRSFIPFIDKYGQFVHADWPGKVHREADLRSRLEKEARDLEAKPGPSDWNRYGGWVGGPQLEATGFFRVRKHLGKWWLVDPEGRLFWSHGIDCVREGNDTPVSDREHYWQWLPDNDSPFGGFYGTGSWAPHGYYSEHTPYRTFDFSRANFLRKYGENWPTKFADITHRRLRSWGMNTIGNWSQSSIYLSRRTPYVGTISFSARRLEGSTGYWGKFFDVFDPSFRERMREAARGFVGEGINDPWCLGFFVHNELAWGDEVSLAIASLKSPADQPAKAVFIEDLRNKYGAVDRLNQAWGAKYASWNDLRESTAEPDRDKAGDDLKTFYSRTAEAYFATIREEFKRVAPHQLYLGCRFAWVNGRAARAAAKYCDVIGYNRYAYGVEEFELPGNLDKPIIIGEFHFGALDRGMFHTGLKPTLDQDDRAEKYRAYVEGALRNPYIVGTHWFQYKDQATTGRGDGENYQIGFIDICDTPHPETIAASRQVGYEMYRLRLAK